MPYPERGDGGNILTAALAIAVVLGGSTAAAFLWAPAASSGSGFETQLYSITDALGYARLNATLSGPSGDLVAVTIRGSLEIEGGAVCGALNFAIAAALVCAVWSPSSANIPSLNLHGTYSTAIQVLLPPGTIELDFSVLLVNRTASVPLTFAVAASITPLGFVSGA